MPEHIDTNDPDTPEGTAHSEELDIAVYYPDDNRWALTSTAITDLADGREKLAARRNSNRKRPLRFKLVVVNRTVRITEVPDEGPVTWRVTAIGVAGTEFTYVVEAPTPETAMALAYARHGNRLRKEHALEALGPGCYATRL